MQGGRRNMMKKLFVILLAMTLILGLAACAAGEQPSAVEEPAVNGGPVKTDAPAQPGDEGPEVVTYYCGIGAYLGLLEEQIDNWNATIGKEENIEIQLISDIQNITTNLEAQMKAGNFFDLFDGGNNPAWVLQGWVRDLNTIDNDELKALIDSYTPYIQNGVSVIDGKLVALPLQVINAKLAVNTDLFEKNGLEYPKTWDDVVACARIISENDTDDAMGFGWSNWSIAFRRFAMQNCIGSTGKGWYDPNTEQYDFSVFKPSIMAVKEMYDNNWMIGADDLGIDPIRARFSEGKVGMMVAYSYDVAVFTQQFPAQCNWTLVDLPTYEAGESPYYDVYMDFNNCSISSGVSDEHLDAVVKAFLFLNSDELNSVIYANGGIIPYKQDVINNTEVLIDVPQWPIMADISNYRSMSLYPDSLLPLEGDVYESVFQSVMHGELEFDEAVADMNERYNAAYQQLKDGNDIDLSLYHYDYSLKK